MNEERPPREVGSNLLLGQRAYDAWCHAGRRTPMPWDLLWQSEREMWTAAAHAVRNQCAAVADAAYTEQTGLTPVCRFVGDRIRETE
jgi:hypothetical protein